MMQSFKNFERLRYRLSSDFSDVIKENTERESAYNKDIAKSIFSAVLSAGISEVAFGKLVFTNQNSNLQSATSASGIISYLSKFTILRMILWIFIFSVGYFLASKFYEWIIQKWKFLNKSFGTKSIAVDKEGLNRIKKDFDNIACDSLLVANDYKKAFDELDIYTDKNIKTFYFFEVMHYLESSCKKTEKLLQFKNQCIRAEKQAEGVDIYRVRNAAEIMRDLYEFLSDNSETILEYELNDNSKRLIKHRIKEISTSLDEIKTKLN